jgi:hypothetical protein
MSLSDWETIWKRQNPPVGAAADIDVLKKTFEARHRKMSRTLLVRDLTEASAGIFVAFVFGRVGWRMGRNGWPITITVLLALGVVGFFIKERLRARRLKVGPDAPILTKLQADLDELRHQRRLLLNIAYWYLAPILLSMVIFGWTLARNSATPLSNDPVFLSIYWTLVAFLNVAVWVMNRRAVQKRINPRIDELEKLQREILSNN